MMTDKQQEVLHAIQDHFQATGLSPTVREIGKAVGLSSSCSVQKHLETLERLGKIRRSTFKYRSIELVDNLPPKASPANASTPAIPFPLTNNSTVFVPLLGHVAGGAPITASQELDPEMLPIPATLLGRGEADQQIAAVTSGELAEGPLFALTVKGDSMEGAGISNGDLVIARRQQTARDGDIVVALVDSEEATVKRFFREGEAVRLEPENSAYAALITTSVQILGKVALSIKRF
ncbi:MAG TPA: transcriptional repressor LexA [Capsulimonadaceae bacterium]|nr:transcriptional repressor LexA [Capsulimonadaceae bacterium]